MNFIVYLSSALGSVVNIYVTGCMIQDSGYTIQDTGCKVQDAEFNLRGYTIQNA
jgi:hypothetical protein